MLLQGGRVDGPVKWACFSDDIISVELDWHDGNCNWLVLNIKLCNSTQITVSAPTKQAGTGHAMVKMNGIDFPIPYVEDLLKYYDYLLTIMATSKKA